MQMQESEGNRMALTEIREGEKQVRGRDILRGSHKKLTIIVERIRKRTR